MTCSNLHFMLVFCCWKGWVQKRTRELSKDGSGGCSSDEEESELELHDEAVER
jgi:hypothetical protein